ncbi:hypothetical protein AHAS_Ahas01G0174500 [Arachis hypogaea]
MGALRVLMKRSLSTSKPYLTPNHPSLTFATLHQYHNRRNLFLHHSASDFVKLHKLSATDSACYRDCGDLDRPGAKNAIGKEMLRGLTRAFEFINQESNVNVAMICSSVPGVFCAGADLKERRNMSQSEVKVFVNSLRSAFLYLEKVCIPTIAVIEGVALGGGLEMALACDIRICGENALMGLPETGLAIIPGAGGTQRLPRLVGNAIAKEIIYTGREINGKEALSLDCYDQVLNTKDRLEGLAAFAEKRKPKYTGE